MVITSGEDTALYSSLLNATDLLETEPLHRFSFRDLVGENGESALRELAPLIGKPAFAADHDGLCVGVGRPRGCNCRRGWHRWESARS